MPAAGRKPRAPLAPGATALAAGSQALAAVVHDGRSADAALADFESHPERSAVRAIALGAMRWYLRLAPALGRLVDRPFDDIAPPLRALLVAAAHQIEYSRNPAESTVHRAVDATRALSQPHASGFVNAVLRRFVRERAAIFVELDRDVAVRTAHPAWFVEALQRAWSMQGSTLALDVLDANNAHPPMTLRVDLSRTSAAAYVAELAALDIAATTLDDCPSAVVLEKAVGVQRLPGFREGRVSVQDAGAQLAAPLLAPSAGQRVLDACAAPGGKTGHLLEFASKLDLVAADVDRGRLELVEETLARLGRRATCVRADLLDPASLAILGGPFDRILVDAPCSSTGVIRRHPDIKLLRRESDVAALAATQLAILRNAFALLRPGGQLVYATCSVLPDEGENVLARFLSEQPEARPLAWPAGLPLPGRAVMLQCGVQLLPGGDKSGDGFYHAHLERVASESSGTR